MGQHEKPPVGQELLPVSNIAYEDVLAFADWRSKRDSVTYRLPTEEEWEYAARNGEKDNLYPWGNTWEAGRAAIQEAGVGAPQAVGTYPQGMNTWGVLDLVGNVWEWNVVKGIALRRRSGQAISPTERLDCDSGWRLCEFNQGFVSAGPGQQYAPHLGRTEF